MTCFLLIIQCGSPIDGIKTVGVGTNVLTLDDRRSGTLRPHNIDRYTLLSELNLLFSCVR
jgi:hypothetical protein